MFGVTIYGKKKIFICFDIHFKSVFFFINLFFSTIFFSKIFGEQKARKKRYNSFLRICNYSYFDSLLTAHTQNDQ
ncbi:ATP-binding protein, partial [Escherichia coli]|uniref:ATP-binding protein n=1 Tax=Escherichia coli TaxID=562 RepID=UPI003B9CCC4B